MLRGKEKFFFIFIPILLVILGIVLLPSPRASAHNSFVCPVYSPTIHHAYHNQEYAVLRGSVIGSVAPEYIYPLHNGVDLTKVGIDGEFERAPIWAALGGVASFYHKDDEYDGRPGGMASNSGNVVVIDHGEGLQSVYGHMEDSVFFDLRLKNIRLSTGDLVGYIGDTTSPGLFTFRHLHFSVIQNGIRVDPLSLVFQSCFFNGGIQCRSAAGCSVNLENFFIYNAEGRHPTTWETPYTYWWVTYNGLPGLP